jgi:hypothetical protein
MKKALFLLVVGVALGYWLGFTDAQGHNENVAVRLINQVGGKTRSTVKSNTDQALDSLERQQ